LAVVTLWHSYSGAERDGLDRSIAVANQRLGGDRIEAVAIPFDALNQKLETAIPRGHGPDLFLAAHDRLGDWRRLGLIAEVAESEASQQLDWPADYLPRVTEALTDDRGRLWAAPWTYKGLVLYRNLELARGPPADLKDLGEITRALPPGAFALAYDTGSLFFHAPFLLACGGGVFERGVDEPARFRIFDEQARTSFALVQDLKRQGAIPQDCSSVLAQQLFNQGRAAMVISGPWFFGGVELEPKRWSVEPLPPIAGQEAGSFVTVEGLFVSASSPEPGAARAAARALSLAWQPRAEVALQPPVLESAYGPEAARGLDPLIHAQRAALDRGRITPSRREMAWVWEPVGGLLRDVIDRDVPLDDALARAEHRLQVLARPAPPPSRPLPYALVASALALLGALVLVRRVLAPGTREAIAEARAPYLLSFPAVLAMVLLVVAPFVAGSLLSLFSHQDGTFTFIGFGNFADILGARDFPATDPLSFYYTLFVTVLWTAVNVALHTGIGLGLALLLRKPWLKLRSFYRVLLILPWAIPSYITALVWRGMFDFQLGAVNGLLTRLGLEPVGWFQGFFPAFAANVTTNTWLGFPFMMVICLGALQAIPQDLEEVCHLEGASRLQSFRFVIWPVIRPALIPAVLLGSVWTFNMFNVIYLVSGGEPGGGTEILISEAYKWAFQRQHRYGYAAAYAVLIFGILVFYGRVLMSRGRGENSA
jgi:arabinogalactan oligomer/maltooligosaccharide transport system permease protein